MPFQWASALPSAYDPSKLPDEISSMQQQRANTDVANQQAQATAIANRQKQYDLGLQKTTEALMAASIDPQSKQVDPGKFYALAAQTPYGISAIKAYADTVFPQGQKQAVEHGGAVQTGAQYDQTIADNPDFATSTRAGAQAALTGPTSPQAMELGSLQRRNLISSYKPTSSLPSALPSALRPPANQAPLQVQDMPTMKPPNIAAAYGSNATDTPPAPQEVTTPAEVEEPRTPGPGEIAMSMEPHLGDQTAAPIKVPAFDISKLSSQSRAQLAQALAAKGITTSDLSAGATQAVQNDINAKWGAASARVFDKDGNPDPLAQQRNKDVFQTTVPSLIQGGLDGLLGSGREQTGANLGQKGATNSLEATRTAEANRQKYATTLGADPDALGQYGSPDAGKVGKAMDERGGAYVALRQQTQELAQNLPSLLLPQNAIALGQEEGSLTRLVNNVAGANGTEGAMRTSLSEAGVPSTLLDSYSPMDALRTFIKQADPTIAQNAIRKLPDILYRNVILPDAQALRMDPDAWKVKLDKQTYRSNQNPGKGTSGNSQDNPITITSKNAPTISGNWYRYNGVTRRAP